MMGAICAAKTNAGRSCRARALPARQMCGSHYLRERRRQFAGEPRGWIIGGERPRPCRYQWWSWAA